VDVTANFGHQSSVIDHVEGGDIPLTTAAGSTSLSTHSRKKKSGEIFGYKALTSVSQLRSDGKTPFIDPADQGNYEIVEGRVVNKTTRQSFFRMKPSRLAIPIQTLTSSFISTITWKNTISSVSNLIG
jgi:hypothetical protein